MKTDKRDARTLADACKLGAHKPAYRTSDARRHLRAQFAVREALVRTRAKLITLTRALLRREGIPVGTGSAAAFPRRLEAVELPDSTQQEVAPVLALMEPLNEQIAAFDEALEREARRDAQVLRLCSAPRIGAVTACAFAAAVDDASRSRRRAAAARAYRGGGPHLPGPLPWTRRWKRASIRQKLAT